MERTPVTSSNIVSVGYSADTQVLEVEFTSGKVYQFAGVPSKTHAEMLAADSVGSFFARNIKGRFNGSIIEEEGNA